MRMNAHRENKKQLFQHKTSEEIPTRVLDEAPIGYAVIDTNLQFRYVNNLLAHINQTPTHQHVGRNVQDIVPSVEKRALIKMKSVLRNETPALNLKVSGAARADHPHRQWLENYYPIHSKETGEVIGIGVVVTDVTERSKFEEQLKASRERLHIALKNSPVSASRVDTNLRYTWVHNIPFDIDKEKLIGKRLDEVLPRDRVKPIMKMKKQTLELEEAQEQEVTVKTNKNTYILNIKTKPIYDDDGNVEGVSTEKIDITRQKQIENLRSHLASIVESSNDAIIGMDSEGIITSWNAGAEDIYGYKKNEVLGTSAKIVFPEEKKDQLDTLLKKVKNGRPVSNMEEQRVDRSGELIDVEISMSPIKNDQGEITGASCIARDISERKELERRKDSFISMASHELKTPLTTLRLYSELLRKECDENDAIKAYASKITEQIERLSVFSSELLDVSNIRANSFSIYQRELDMNHIVQTVINDMQAIIDHEIKLRDASDTPITVTGDEERLRQVLNNLISNAAKYSPDADTIEVSVQCNKDDAIVSVKDFGIGIPEHCHKDIFTPFFRVQGKSEKTFPGLGVGLHISKEIIRKHNGDIWLKNNEEKGTTFYFSLPLSE